MLRQSPIRSDLHGKRVLLVDRCEATREVRAAVLQSHGVEVHAADSLQAARFLWQPDFYSLILLDVKRHLPGETLEFYEQIKRAQPGQRFAFLVGPPVYLSRTWPQEVMAADKEPQQWDATVRRLSAAA